MDGGGNARRTVWAMVPGLDAFGGRAARISDQFMAPYAGHPIQGSIFGYILRQNDPKYRDVQWGDGRDYFVSLLRSMGFSAIWHTQWKIGPASEASIGNVMLHASPGFITLVDTPIFTLTKTA